MSDWIKASDRLPAHGGEVLVVHPDAIGNRIRIARLEEGARWRAGTTHIRLSMVSHWQELPEPPPSEG